MTEAQPDTGRFRTSIRSVNALIRTVVLLTAGAIAACGGGGSYGSSPPPPPPPPPPPTTGWQQGVFLAASTFQNQCQSPRSGVDINGNPSPDIQGLTLDENNFLRSFSDDTYLWFDEIVDQDPGLFSDPVTYFIDELRTADETAPGIPKDKFHFIIPTDEWLQLSQSGVSAGYGAQWVLLSTTPPREVVVAFTEPNSPATAVNLARGARLLSINGFDINDNTQAGIDALNNGLFPAGAGEMHSFEVLDLGAQNPRPITMTSDNITSEPVKNVGVEVTPTGRVGYMLFNDHIATAEQALIDAVNQLDTAPGIDDLVLDIRYNGGGFLDIASELAYMVAGVVPTAGQPFEILQFNSKHPVNFPGTNIPITPTPLHTTSQGFNNQGAQALPTLDLPRVFVLTGPGTCSASEAIMNGLRGVNVEVIQIGSTTCGKPYGFFPTGNCGTHYFTIQFRGVNAMNFGDYTDGFKPANATNDDGTPTPVPGCSIADDFTAALGDPTETRFATALAYRDNPTCPAPTGITVPGISKASRPLSATEGIVPKSPWHTNRIMRRP